MTSPLDQKIRITGPVVITANRLTDGAVVYRRANGGWSTRLDEAAIATSAATARELLAAADADGRRAVGAYVAPVVLAAGGAVRPGNLRELIRAGGPTVEASVSISPEAVDVSV
jgi:predicted NAD/FAD-binding protein